MRSTSKVLEEMEAIILDRFREASTRVEELRLRGLMDVEALKEYSRLRKASEWMREGMGRRYFELGGGRLLLAERLRLREGLRVLDIGSGDGWFSIQAGYLHRDVEFHGVELSEEYAEAAEYAEIFGLENVHFYYFDAYDMPFPDESFDRAALFFSLANIALDSGDIFRLFRECWRILRAEGLLGIAEPLLEDFPEPLRALLLQLYRESGNRSETLLSRSQMLRGLEEAGFNVLSEQVMELRETGSPIAEAEGYLEEYYGRRVSEEAVRALRLERIWVRDDPPRYRLIVAEKRESSNRCSPFSSRLPGS